MTSRFSYEFLKYLIISSLISIPFTDFKMKLILRAGTNVLKSILTIFANFQKLFVI
jgi:hypothetical protein